MSKEITDTLYKALVIVEGDEGLIECEVIALDGEFWLVPNWLVSQDGRVEKPERIVQLRWLVRNPPADPSQGFVVEAPVPRDVLYGPSPQSAKLPYVVIGMPDVYRIVPKSQPGH